MHPFKKMILSLTLTNVTVPGNSFKSIQGVGPNTSFQTDSCSILMSGTLTTMYIDMVGLIIQIGDHLYTTQSENSPVSDGWYVVDDYGVNTRVKVDVGTGEIIQILNC